MYGLAADEHAIRPKRRWFLPASTLAREQKMLRRTFPTGHGSFKSRNS